MDALYDSLKAHKTKDFRSFESHYNYNYTVLDTYGGNSPLYNDKALNVTM